MQSFWRVDVTLRARENELCVTEGDCVIRGKLMHLLTQGADAPPQQTLQEWTRQKPWEQSPPIL